MTRSELFCPYSLLLRSPLLFLTFVSSHVGNFSCFSFFYHCCFCIRNSHCLRHRNEFVNKIVMIQRIHPFSVIWSWWCLCTAPSWSRARHQQYKRILSCVFQYCGLLLHCFWRYFARHCWWHRNFQLSTSGFDCELEFFVIWFVEEYSLQVSGIVELWFLDSPSLFCFLFFAASDMCYHLSDHTLSGREVVCFLVSLPTDHVYPSGGLSFNKVNLVKPVHASDHSLSISTFQSSSICFSNITSKDVWVVLVTSMYFIGLGTYSLTRCTTWWRQMNSPVIVQKSFFASSSSRVESPWRWHLNFLEVFLVLRLVRVDPGLRWMFSDAVLTPRFFLFHLRVGIWSFHFCEALTLPLHCAFWRGVQMRPSPPILQCLRFSLVSFPDSPSSRTMRNREIHLARLLLQNWFQFFNFSNH